LYSLTFTWWNINNANEHFFQISAIANTYATKEGAEFYSSKIKNFVEMKVDFVKKLADVAPVIEGLLTACSLVTQSNKLTMAIGVAKMAKVSQN
jgi:hypothetical protein